jgi:hypothetical protein
MTVIFTAIRTPQCCQPLSCKCISEKLTHFWVHWRSTDANRFNEWSEESKMAPQSRLAERNCSTNRDKTTGQAVLTRSVNSFLSILPSSLLYLSLSSSFIDSRSLFPYFPLPVFSLCPCGSLDTRTHTQFRKMGSAAVWTSPFRRCLDYPHLMHDSKVADLLRRTRRRTKVLVRLRGYFCLTSN